MTEITPSDLEQQEALVRVLREQRDQEDVHGNGLTEALGRLEEMQLVFSLQAREELNS